MRYFKSYIWAILWATLICVLLLLPSNDFEGIPVFEGIDKIVHLGIFFVQASLLYLGAMVQSNQTVNKWLSVLSVISITAVFAVLTELAQFYFTDSRSADPWDIFADMVGSGMAAFGFLLFYRRKK